MSSSKLGGRPKNAWNSSRRRKLVRLYTLTTVRFGRLIQHRQARKSRTTANSQDNQEQSTNLGKKSNISQDKSQAFEGPPSAFRNYGGGYNGFANWPRLCLSAHPSESQLIVPSLLLLDGSSIASTVHIPHGELQCDGMEPALSVSSPAVSYQPSTNHSVSASSPETSRSPGDQSPIDQSPIPSLESPEPRIAHRPPAELRHIESVLRYSLTNSWRSSTSWQSSWLSLPSSLPPTHSTATEDSNGFASDDRDTQAATLSPGSPGFPLAANLRDQFTKSLKMIFGESGDEKSPYPRPASNCCTYKHYEGMHFCDVCGLRSIHLFAESSVALQLIPSHLLQQINQQDYFGNRPLHFAAASKNRDPDSLVRLIDMGACMESINTHGATFLHILFGNLRLKFLSKFFPLLKYLATLNFPFSTRDYHRRQIFHLCLERNKSLGYESLEDLEEAFAIVTIDVDALDNLGNSVRKYILKFPENPKSQVRARQLLSKDQISENRFVKFQSTLSQVHPNWST